MRLARGLFGAYITAGLLPPGRGPLLPSEQLSKRSRERLAAEGIGLDDEWRVPYRTARLRFPREAQRCLLRELPGRAAADRQSGRDEDRDRERALQHAHRHLPRLQDPQ